jgi:transcriptional regulator of acetoin/glycerol metabolism
VLESAVIRAGGRRVEAQHLPPEIRGGNGGEPGSPDEEEGRYSAVLTPDEEAAAIRAALGESDGVRARAAEMLGMSRTTLWRKMKEYGIE